jgi:hypothetical protein
LDCLLTIKGFVKVALNAKNQRIKDLNHARNKSL